MAEGQKGGGTRGRRVSVRGSEGRESPTQTTGDMSRSSGIFATQTGEGEATDLKGVYLFSKNFERHINIWFKELRESHLG